MIGLVQKRQRKVSNNNNNITTKEEEDAKTPGESGFRTFLLTALTFVYGCEFMQKCTNRDLIFITNECHALTVVHIIVLALMPWQPAQPLVRELVEILVPMSWGAIGGLLLPATASRTVIFSRASYHIQHWLLTLIPLYYLTQYPSLWNTNSDAVSKPAKLFYAIAKSMVFKICMTLSVAWISWLTMANINLTLCPDPLPAELGRYYRWYLICCVPLFHGITWCLYTNVATLIFTVCNHFKVGNFVRTKHLTKCS